MSQTKTPAQKLADALTRLMYATDHYGFRDENSEAFWESRADNAAEGGKISDDIRREEWENARQALVAAEAEGAI